MSMQTISDINPDINIKRVDAIFQFKPENAMELDENGDEG